MTVETVQTVTLPIKAMYWRVATADQSKLQAVFGRICAKELAKLVQTEPQYKIKRKARRAAAV